MKVQSSISGCYGIHALLNTQKGNALGTKATFPGEHLMGCQFVKRLQRKRSCWGAIGRKTTQSRIYLIQGMSFYDPSHQSITNDLESPLQGGMPLWMQNEDRWRGSPETKVLQRSAQGSGYREKGNSEQPHTRRGMVRVAEKDVASRPRSDPRAQRSPFQS